MYHEGKVWSGFIGQSGILFGFECDNLLLFTLILLQFKRSINEVFHKSREFIKTQDSVQLAEESLKTEEV